MLQEQPLHTQTHTDKQKTTSAEPDAETLEPPSATAGNAVIEN